MGPLAQTAERVANSTRVVSSTLTSAVLFCVQKSSIIFKTKPAFCAFYEVKNNEGMKNVYKLSAFGV